MKISSANYYVGALIEAAHYLKSVFILVHLDGSHAQLKKSSDFSSLHSIFQRS